jgi:hypothetical protein
MLLRGHKDGESACKRDSVQAGSLTCPIGPKPGLTSYFANQRLSPVAAVSHRPVSHLCHAGWVPTAHKRHGLGRLGALYFDVAAVLWTACLGR